MSMPEPIRAPRRSISEVLGGIVSDGEQLVRQEVRLLRAQIRDDLDRRRAASALLALGFCFAIGAVLLATMTVVTVIQVMTPLSEWASLGVATLVFMFMTLLCLRIHAKKVEVPDGKRSETD